jgi:hypothetical protein
MSKTATAPRGPQEAAGDLPAWVPEAARTYLAHTEGGRTIRDLAREARVAPSTILRRVRRIESLRDDFLVDDALRSLGHPDRPGDPVELWRRAAPVLRRLADPGTLLAAAPEMDKAVVLREGPTGQHVRLLVCDRSLAEAMALHDWIQCDDPGARIGRYRLTNQGRHLLREFAEAEPGGLGEAPVAFRGPGRRPEPPAEETDPHLRHMRSMLAEGPLPALARRRDGEGRPFLTRAQVAAGERLREDFELAGLDPDDDEGLRRLVRGGPGRGAPGARARLARALEELGPDLGDVALRSCCLLEGLESIERRLGWSARSGKVVLRIALDRLGRHYAQAEQARSA